MRLGVEGSPRASRSSTRAAVVLLGVVQPAQLQHLQLLGGVLQPPGFTSWALLPPLGHEQPHPAAPPLGEPLGQGVGVLQLVLDQDLRRHVGGGVVELLEEGGEHRRRRPRPRCPPGRSGRCAPACRRGRRTAGRRRGRCRGPAPPRPGRRRPRRCRSSAARRSSPGSGSGPAAGRRARSSAPPPPAPSARRSCPMICSCLPSRNSTTCPMDCMYSSWSATPMQGAVQRWMW